jgi:hypothetical protein
LLAVFVNSRAVGSCTEVSTGEQMEIIGKMRVDTALLAFVKMASDFHVILIL